MTPKEILIGLGRLKGAYQSAKFDDFNTAAYSEIMAGLNNDDFDVARLVLVQTCKFFPSIAEISEAVLMASKDRFKARDRIEREERLALQAGEEAIMNPKSGFHRVIQGPNHQKFIDMIEGRIVLPQPDWRAERLAMLQKKAKEIR